MLRDATSGMRDGNLSGEVKSDVWLCVHFIYQSQICYCLTNPTNHLDAEVVDCWNSISQKCPVGTVLLLRVYIVAICSGAMLP